MMKLRNSKQNHRLRYYLTWFLIILGRPIVAQNQTAFQPIGNYPELNTALKAGKPIQNRTQSFKNEVNGKISEMLLARSDQFTHPWYDVSFVNPQAGIVVGAGLSIYQTKNAGKQWTVYQFSNENNAFRNILQTANHFYILGEDSKIFRANKTTMNWEVFDTQTYFPTLKNPFFYKAIALDHNNLLLLGGTDDQALILRSSDAGQTWNRIAHQGLENASQGLRDLVLLKPNLWIAIDDGIGRIFQSNDQGQHWVEKTMQIQLQADLSLKTLVAINDSTLYAAGARAFYVSHNAGETWKSLSIPTTDSFDEILNNNDNLILTKLVWGNQQLFASSSMDDPTAGRRTWAYRLDQKQQKLIPIVKTSQIKFTGDAHSLQILDTQHIFLLDTDRLILLKK